MEFLKKWWSESWATNIDLLLQFLLLVTTVYIGMVANGIADRQNAIAIEQTKFAQEQTRYSSQQTTILSQQTEILKTQTALQEQSLTFDKEKNWADTAREYREKLNGLYDKITTSDGILIKVHDKIKNRERIQDIKNLDRYVWEFEDIGALFCEGKVKIADIRTILKSNLVYVCWSDQIYNHYQDTKSGLSGMCSVIFPKSTGMAKFANPTKCPLLK